MEFKNILKEAIQKFGSLKKAEQEIKKEIANEQEIKNLEEEEVSKKISEERIKLEKKDFMTLQDILSN